MAIVVTKENRHQYRSELQQMYSQRYRIFVEQLHWNLPQVKNDLVNGDEVGENLECDEFDTDDTIYLLLLDKHGNVQGSNRLIPTVSPHLMSEIFPHLVEGEIPRGCYIWESSRSYILPEKRSKSALGELFLAMLEIGLLLEIQKITFVCDMNLLSRILQAGWELDLLGMPETNEDGEVISASSVNVNLNTLHSLRQHYDIIGSVLDDMPVNIAARLKESKQRERRFDNNHMQGDVTCLKGTTWVSYPDIQYDMLRDGSYMEKLINDDCHQSFRTISAAHNPKKNKNTKVN